MDKVKEYVEHSREENIKNAWEIIFDNIYGHSYWREDPNLKDTPIRITKSMIQERCIGIGCEKECESMLAEQFPTSYDGLVTIGPLTVYSLCPHHFENISYSVYFGYMPSYKTGNVVGISKPGKVIKLFARQPILQEDYTRKLANMFMKTLEPEGIGLIVKGKHVCMAARGLEQPNTYTTTSEMRGCFRDHKTVKDEFMEFCKEY